MICTISSAPAPASHRAGAGVVIWTSPIAPRTRHSAPARKSSPVDPWVTCRGRGRGDRANHGKTKYLRVDGNHANHKKTNYSCFGGRANQNSAVSRSRDVLAVARYDVIPGRRAPARRRGFPGAGGRKNAGGPGRSLLIGGIFFRMIYNQ